MWRYMSVNATMYVIYAGLHMPNMQFLFAPCREILVTTSMWWALATCWVSGPRNEAFSFEHTKRLILPLGARANLSTCTDR